MPLYRSLHPLLRWDSRTEFVQAIKLSMDLSAGTAGRADRPAQPLPAGTGGIGARIDHRQAVEQGWA